MTTMNPSNPLSVTLPTAWSPEVDQEMEDQLKVLEAQALALRWERFMHRFFQAWPPDIDAVSFRHYSVGSGLDLEVDIEMPDRMYPVGPDGHVEGMARPASKPLGVMDVHREMLKNLGQRDKLSLRQNLYETEVVQPFRRELCGAIAAQSFPVEWVRKVLDCRSSSPRRTKEEWQARSQAMVEELVGHYRLASRLDTSLEAAPSRRPPRV